MIINKILGHTSDSADGKHNPRFHMNTYFLHANSKYLNIIFPRDNIFTPVPDWQSHVNVQKWDAWMKPRCTINLEVGVSNSTQVWRRGRAAD